MKFNSARYWLGKKRPLTEETKEKMRKPKSEKAKENMRLNHPRYWLGKKRKSHSKATKQKMRISHINHRFKTGWDGKCIIGKNEKELLDRQEKIDNCKIIRQFPIQSLGYIVDGYCPETNIIYEVYEKWHQKNIDRDLIRQGFIQEYLKCEFIIIWDI